VATTNTSADPGTGPGTSPGTGRTACRGPRRGTGWAQHPQQRGLLDAALCAAAAGCYVFPVRPGSKIPALHGARDCKRTGACAGGHQGWEQRATRDETQIRTWWRHPFNIGIAAGRSGLLVVDLDDAHGETPTDDRWSGARHGRDVLAMLAEQAGQPLPTDTLHVLTPTGGSHLYFRVPAGASFRNTASTLGWKIDTRADGGFIVGPGSVRREGTYRVARRGPIAELPGWLATALTPPPPPTPTATAIALPDTRASRYLAAIVDDETDTVRRAAKGARRATLLAAARTLGRLVGGGELPQPEAHAALLHAAAAHIGVEQFTRAEAEKTITDGMAYGMQLPRQIRRNCT
jgi:hypothetical protein